VAATAAARGAEIVAGRLLGGGRRGGGGMGGEGPEQEIAGRPLGDLGSGSFFFNRFGREKIK